MQRKIINSSVIHEDNTLSNGAKVYVLSEGIIEESKFHSNFNYNEITLVGEFSIDYDENDLLLEDRKIADIIKSGKKTLNYQIYVYSNEGPVPHFHLIETTEKDRDKKTDCCICIFEAKYFDHGSHVSALNNKELKILDSFLRSKNNTNTSYWQSIVLFWDYSNPDNAKKYPQFRLSTIQPDYTHMVEYKTI